MNAGYATCIITCNILDWTEVTEQNVLLYDGTQVLTGLLLLCAWLHLTILNKRI